MSDHEELESNLAAWVLGALDREEAEVVQAHVEGCASCRETVARLQRAVGAMPLAVDEIAPPPRLRERVLAAAAASSSSAVASSRVRKKVTRPMRRNVLPRFRAAAGLRRRRRGHRRPGGGVIAGDLASSRRRPVRSRASRSAATSRLPGRSYSHRPQDRPALVDCSVLRAVGQGRGYEVLLIRSGGRADPAAVFVPDSNGSKVVLVNRALQGYALMAITDEAGPDGTQAPTQQPQLYGSVA
jgi:anti-sigma factor RsiW